MDATPLVQEVAHLFGISGYHVEISVTINYREIDVVAEETQGLIRKKILVECADLSRPVGVEKIQEDHNKLQAAREQLKENAVFLHVSRHGYTSQASGFALSMGLDICSIEQLSHRLVNFNQYISAIENEKLRETILTEYQPTKIHFDNRASSSATSAIDFLNIWLAGSDRWLTVLGDYGVGKSWMLKRFLYHILDRHKADPSRFPLPFFVPLQRFTKAFDYQNLILRVFQMHGLSGVPYTAFEHLARSGQILFLFDSFDEMAQHLHRDTIRENLNELLVGIAGNSRAIMTSRPTYFESQAERLLAIETNGVLSWHPLDRTAEERKSALSDMLSRSLDTSQFARLMDLSPTQRRKLFAIVLGPETKAYRTLIQLLERFQELGSISQRAVIARLLTTVAETLAAEQTAQTIGGYRLIPDDLEVLNQAKIFEIVVYNLLQRDDDIGTLPASERYRFLKSFAVFLQQPGQWPFATPEEIRGLVERLFSDLLRRSDTRQQMLEQFYRTCRRHSGLTTESQFQDTTGQVDLPVEETDSVSRVGFSHNSLREYLVADAFADYLSEGYSFEKLSSVTITETVAGFFADLVVYATNLLEKLSDAYRTCPDSNMRERLFRLLFGLVTSDPATRTTLLGAPPILKDLDLSGLDFSGLPLIEADFSGSLMPEVDLRKANLRGAVFKGTILDLVMLEDAVLVDADFLEAEVESIFVFDEFDRRTRAVLRGREARQWLFSRGARVAGSRSLNPLLGKPWYEAAREVTRTLMRRAAGTHQDRSLAKGTKLEYRQFAQDFVRHLQRRGVLETVKRDKDVSIVRLAAEHRDAIRGFNDEGLIDSVLQEFFDKYT